MIKIVLLERLILHETNCEAGQIFQLFFKISKMCKTYSSAPTSSASAHWNSSEMSTNSSFCLSSSSASLCDFLKATKLAVCFVRSLNIWVTQWLPKQKQRLIIEKNIYLICSCKRMRGTKQSLCWRFWPSSRLQRACWSTWCVLNFKRCFFILRYTDLILTYVTIIKPVTFRKVLPILVQRVQILGQRLQNLWRKLFFRPIFELLLVLF